MVVADKYALEIPHRQGYSILIHDDREREDRMSVWFTLLAAVAALGLGALFYLVTRVRRFSCLRRLAETHRGLSWLLATGAVGLLFLFWLVNLYAVFIVVLHLALFWLLCDLVAWVVKRIRHREPRRYYAGAVAILLTALYLGAGWAAAHRIRETDYTVETQKATDPLRVVLMADAHLGVTLDGDGFTATMARIEALRPDVVVMVGDYVDDDSTRADMLAASRALGALETTYGVYYVYGNHDNGYFRHRDFTAQELRAALTESGVTILEDETALLGDGYALIGRRDRSSAGRLSMAELLPGPSQRFTIVLDHQPNDYDAQAAAGADLVLSGHTHGGHIFPAGLIGLWIGANDATYGLSRRGDTTFIVTSGLSGWAIPFKTGAFSEFVVIDIQ